MSDMTRSQRLAELLEEFPVDPDLVDVDLGDPFRFAAVKRSGNGGDHADFTIDTFDSLDEALRAVGDEILAQYPWVPETIVDLDTGERMRLDVHVTVAD